MRRINRAFVYFWNTKWKSTAIKLVGCAEAWNMTIDFPSKKCIFKGHLFFLSLTLKSHIVRLCICKLMESHLGFLGPFSIYLSVCLSVRLARGTDSAKFIFSPKKKSLQSDSNSTTQHLFQIHIQISILAELLLVYCNVVYFSSFKKRKHTIKINS